MSDTSAPVIWVPGGTGLLGRAVCRAIAARGAVACPTGRAIDIADAGHVERHVERRPPFAAIVNCAAKTAVDACENELDDAVRINVDGPRVLAQCARALDVPLAHVSTDYVFDGQATCAYVEDDAVAPVTVYGQTKSDGERALWQALGPHPLGYVVRTAWLFGHDKGNFVATMLRLMRERDEVQVVFDQVGSPTFCDDLAEALLDLVGLTPQGPLPGGTYHFANGGQTSWHGLAEATWRYALAQGAALRCRRVEPVTSEAFVRPAKRPAFSVLSTDKIAQVTGRVPRAWGDALVAYLGSYTRACAIA